MLRPTDVVADVACGTGDLSLKFAAKLDAMRNLALPDGAGFGRVIGIDFTYEMLPLAVTKSKRSLSDRELYGDPLSDITAFVNGDAQSLPLSDRSADVVSIAFGIRNVQGPAAAMREFYRVLRPGGRVIVLEFSLPTNRVLRALYNFYFRHILPCTATLISGDKTGAYKYLPESVCTFIGRDEMMRMMTDAGFTRVEQFPMTFGVCICYRGVKT